VKTQVKRAFVFPGPVTLVTVADAAGGANIVTLAWVGMACSDPVCVTIAVRPSRHSHGLLKASGEFCVNIPSEDMAAATDLCGVVSGRDTDKWAAAGFTSEPAEHVSAPRIAECRYSLECRVVHSVVLGAHELFVGEVLGAYADESVLDEQGSLDYGLLRPFAYLPHHYHSVGPRLYEYGQSNKA
jgi:flavin reductase (DIM6/NTAB) family NADH-FMN oxidoreductase RutF